MNPDNTTPAPIPWVDVNDRTPLDGEYVLAHMIPPKKGWAEHNPGSDYVVAKFKRGISKTEREKMRLGEMPDPDSFGWIETGTTWVKSVSKRSSVLCSEDEDSNNQRPYAWDVHGTVYKSQQVDYWMPLPYMPANIRPTHTLV